MDKLSSLCGLFDIYFLFKNSKGGKITNKKIKSSKTVQKTPSMIIEGVYASSVKFYVVLVDTCYLINCFTFTDFFSLLTLMISPIILMAISAVVSEPISNPIGE